MFWNSSTIYQYSVLLFIISRLLIISNCGQKLWMDNSVKYWQFIIIQTIQIKTVRIISFQKINAIDDFLNLYWNEKFSTICSFMFSLNAEPSKLPISIFYPWSFLTFAIAKQLSRLKSVILPSHSYEFLPTQRRSRRSDIFQWRMRGSYSLSDQLEDCSIHKVSLYEYTFNNRFIHVFYYLFSQLLQVAADARAGMFEQCDSVAHSFQVFAEQANSHQWVVAGKH